MASNDDIRLKMTVSKMNNVHRSTKLETIAVNCIARNLDSFLNPKNSKTRHIKLLPIGLRNIVFQQWLMKHFAELHIPQYDYYLSKKNYNRFFEKTMKVFQTLVSCHTLNVDFTPFTKNIYNSLKREQRFEYLNLIGAKATNLKELTLSNCYPYDDDEEQNITLCNVIGKLRNLESLNIGDIHVKYTNLKAMCRNLEHLTHLSTRIIFDPRFDESNESDIEDLQIFSNFIFFDHGSFDEKFTLNCIQHLPKLQCVGRLGFPVLKTSMIEELLDRCPNQKFALKNLVLSARSNKEIHLSFPNVTNLQIGYLRMASDDVIIPNSLKFSKIENLTLSLANSTDKLIPFLDAYGHGLYSLTIKHCRGQFKLSTILDRCPKLQSLFLECVFILPECSRPDIHSFSTGLKEFELLRLSYSNDDNALLLLDILSVPTLECVTLRMSCERLHLEDIKKLTAMVASRQILGNLKRLKIFVDNMERDYNHLVFYTLNDFIKSASAFLPHLTEIKTDILSKIQVGTSSAASLQVATLKQFIDVYQN